MTPAAVNGGVMVGGVIIARVTLQTQMLDLFVTVHFHIFNCKVNPMAPVEVSLKGILIRYFCKS